MRIISVRPASVGRIFIIPYAIIGLMAYLTYAFGYGDYITLPIGIIAPSFHLNFNLNLGRSRDVVINILLVFATILSYAITGWISGIAAALCFNFFAKRMGGIDAKYVVLSTDKMPQNTDSGNTLSSLS